MTCLSCKNDIYSSYYIYKNKPLCDICHRLIQLELTTETNEDGLFPYVLVVLVAGILGGFWFFLSKPPFGPFLLSPVVAYLLSVILKRLVRGQGVPTPIVLFLFVFLLLGVSILYYTRYEAEGEIKMLFSTLPFTFLINFVFWFFSELIKYTHSAAVILAFYVILRSKQTEKMTLRGPYPFEPAEYNPEEKYRQLEFGGKSGKSGKSGKKEEEEFPLSGGMPHDPHFR